MAAKRALIVDDSRSARLILERILEKYDIDVDSAESAEAAIEYLASNRPDVIFMDHLMPGMDGLQAVQAIKNNPLTATIPIMMYTSQEGELYLGQARALGALGVLPKQIKPADVSKVLYQLHLVQDRRTSEQSALQPVQESEAQPPLPIEDQVATTAGKPLTDSTLREHFAEVRRALIASIDTQTDRLSSELRATLLQALPQAGQPASFQLRPSEWGWIAAGVALVLAVLFAGLWVRDTSRLAALTVELAQLQPRIAQPAAPTAHEVVRDVSPAKRPQPEAPSPPQASKTAVARVAAADLKPLMLLVPYGADAMASGRLDEVRQFLYRLLRAGVTGVVDIKTFAGRFCLLGNVGEGFSLAPEEMPYAKCDLVGNPSDDALSPSQRIPVALANLAEEVRHATHSALDVQISPGDASVTVMPYPVVASDLTAGEWNRAGSSNNRIEVRLR
jgi:CheY-like chemotaxis protein